MMGNLKVLMADDEKDILEVMAKKVAQEGYAVITAQDGEEALAKIKAESPDIILLDLTMPKMDGYAILKNLKENPSSEKRQAVIIVSAKGELDDMQKGFSLEADHYITKPCKIEDILKGIKLMAGILPQRKTASELHKE
jgi:DNA-binding response OmpR family regulator